MKKIIITLGFAAATILAANAQDGTLQDTQNTDIPSQTTPATDNTVEPQTEPMQNPSAYEQDETLDTQTETMQDQARRSVSVRR